MAGALFCWKKADSEDIVMLILIQDEKNCF